MVEITDFESAETWFETQDQATCAALASRSALRVWANIQTVVPKHFDSLAVGSLRACLTSACRGLDRQVDVDWLIVAASSAISASTSLTVIVSSAVSSVDTLNAISASRFAAAAVSRHPSASAAKAVAVSFHPALSIIPAYSALSSDTNQGSDTVAFNHTLWPADLLPDHMATAHTKFTKRLSAKPEIWAWWHDWYLGIWNGTPLNWDMALEVAKIPNDDWEQGATHIAEIIEPIWERYKLKERIAELEALMPGRATARLGIGGNNPPEALDDIKTPEQAITLIWAAIDELKDEADAEKPDWEKVKRALLWLKSAIET
jgi:hypothetical protein